MTVKTFKWMNSFKFRVSLLAKHQTYQTLNEYINVAINIVILPIKECKSSSNIQHADIVDVKFFVKFFHRKSRERADRQTVDESNSIKLKTTFVGKHTTY